MLHCIGPLMAEAVNRMARSRTGMTELVIAEMLLWRSN
jgi:hypothetical protein